VVFYTIWNFGIDETIFFCLKTIMSVISLNLAIGSDHHGVEIRIKTAEFLRQIGHTVLEFGPSLEDKISVDYPDVASGVAMRVSNHSVDRGILICGTGIGMCITANKFAGVRAAPIIDELSAELSRRHNDLNVLCLSGDTLDEEAIHRIIDIWLATPFDGGRHEKRIEKIEKIEKQLGLI
jgi:ribose 5-phosphate isomerase B